MQPFVEDFASVDGNTQRDYLKVKASGVRGVLVRGAFGRKVQPQDRVIYLDPCATDMPLIRKVGLRTGSYLFVCVPRTGHETPEPELQVDAWLDYVMPLVEKHKDVVGGIDIEEDSDILNSEEMFEWYERSAIRYHERVGCWPNAYTSNRFWTESLKNHPPGKLVKCPLWLAKPWPWPIRTPIQFGDVPTQPYLIPEFGNQWFLYQRQGDATGAPGFNRTVDVSVVRQFGVSAKGDHVKMLQQWLNASGKLPPTQLLKVDGDFGPKTKTALETVQHAFGIDVDGVFGLQSLCVCSWFDLG